LINPIATISTLKQNPLTIIAERRKKKPIPRYKTGNKTTVPFRRRSSPRSLNSAGVNNNSAQSLTNRDEMGNICTDPPDSTSKRFGKNTNNKNNSSADNMGISNSKGSGSQKKKDNNPTNNNTSTANSTTVNSPTSNNTNNNNNTNHFHSSAVGGAHGNPNSRGLTGGTKQDASFSLKAGVGALASDDASGRGRSDSTKLALAQKTEAKSAGDFEKLRETLRQHPWFSSHTSSQIDDIARFMKLKTLTKPANEVIFSPGDQDDHFYVVKSGEFKLVEGPPSQGSGGGGAGAGGGSDNSPSSALSEQRLGEWSCFGESVLRFKAPRTDKVTLVSPKGEVWYIHASEYQSIIVKEQAARERGRLGFLRSVPLLAQLTDEQVGALSKCLTRQVFRPGQRIIEQNTRGTEFFFVEKGSVRAVQRTQKGDKEVSTEVNSFGPGDYFGEGAMLRDEPRTADCVAVGTEEVVTLVLKKSDFVELLGGLENLIESNFIARTLRAVEILHGLTDAELAEVADNLKTEKFAPGATIIQQGDHGDKFYIIKEGEVVFWRKKGKKERQATLTTVTKSLNTTAADDTASESPSSPKQGGGGGGSEPTNESEEIVPEDAVPTEIGRLFAGQVFGEGALLTDAPRRATAKAAGPVTLLSLERSVFSRVFDSSLQELLNRDFAKRRDLDETNRKDLLEFGDLDFQEILGIGTYGQVLLVSHRVTGATYALKVMSKKKIREQDQVNHVRNERDILSMMNHPFVVNLVQTFMSKDHVFALMEAVLGGELFAYLRSVARLRPKDARFYLAQIVLTFEYIHSLNIIYRDLKPENLLITPSGYVKMADFGLSKILPPGESTYTLCGTPAYAAPEVYAMKGHGKACDWWGLGVLCHELISGATPFDGDATGIFDAMQRYSRAYPNIRLPRRLEGSLAGDLALKLLHPNPFKRLGTASVNVGQPGHDKVLTGARAVKAHAFFDQDSTFNWNDLAKMKIEAPYKPKIEGMYDTKNFYEPTVDHDGIVDLDGIDPKSIVAGQSWVI
jgi:CRP-like cAMP-binding protein